MVTNLKVVLSPALESNLPKGEGNEQSQVPCNQPQPVYIEKTNIKLLFNFYTI